jgi:hypothetical protein
VATSGNSNYSLTRNDIIQEALELIGVVAAEESPAAADVATADRSLNMMVKGWAAKGINLWRQTEGSLTATAGQASFTMGTGGDYTTARPLRISSARLSVSSIETPLTEMSRQEYFDLPLKTSTGRPTGFYYDPQMSLGKIYLWPTVATGITATLKFTYQRTIEDFDVAGDEPDFPQEWFECIAYNLAARLAPKFGTTISQEVMAIALGTLDDLMGWDREPASVFFQPAEW